MKDSGIEWLGEIPEHWEVQPIKRFLESVNRRRIPLSTVERSARQGDFPYYGASGIIDFVDDYLFDEPLVLIAEDGANLVNRGSRLAFVAEGKYWVNNHAHILKPRFGCVHFWAARLEAEDFVPYVSGSAQPKLTQDALGAVLVTAPADPKEQHAIGEHVRAVDAQYDRLTGSVSSSLDRLREYRQALITAAVSGTIDLADNAADPSPP